MKTTQMFPFERNRYYYGKMLTSQDFRAEQQYINHKRMFMNQMVLGAGVMCGLNVFNLDDLSVLVESGTAVDPEGREIVVEKSVVKKLSALDGYQEEGSGCLCLCLRYREEKTQPVYVLNRKEDQREYEENRIEEGYELFLMDAGSADNGFELDSEFFVETKLWHDQDYQVTLRMPAYVCRGRKVKVSVEAVKLSEREKELSLSYTLYLPAFLAEDGGNQLKITETGIELPRGDKKRFDYWLYTQSAELTQTNIIIKAQDERELEMKVFLTDEEPETLVLRTLGKSSLEIRGSARRRDFIRLANLYLTHTRTACVIDRIEEDVKSYIPLPANESARAEYLSYFGTGDMEEAKDKPDQESQEEALLIRPGKPDDSQQPPPLPSVWQSLPVSGGTLEIPLEQKMKRGSVCFSEEISHGLGPGSVYVAVGIDEPEDGAHARKQTASTIYGDMELFTDQNPQGTCVKLAVKVWEGRGSFQAAAKLTGEQHTVLLSLHWIAVRLPGVADDSVLELTEPMQITPETVTVSLRPKEKHYFAVSFHNMKPCRLRYEVMDEGGGRIEEDGTYTAPMHAGVYEIKICCEEHKEICTYAYVVVSVR